MVHVHALQSAAGLPGVEIRAVDDVLDGVLEIGVVPHVHRIAAAELEPHADETRGRRALHGAAAGDRARERDEVDARIADDEIRVLMRGMQDLERALRAVPRPSRHSAKRSAASGVCAECFSTTTLPAMSAGTTLFTAMRIRVVPGGHGEDHAQRLAAHEAL